MLIRALKYILNFIGLCWMFYLAYFSYAVFVRMPDCAVVMEVIWDRVGELAIGFAVFLLLSTALNLFVERKIEKRRTSKEYVVILAIHLVVLTVGIVDASNDFRNLCVDYASK